jgi:hypothetical protein
VVELSSVSLHDSLNHKEMWKSRKCRLNYRLVSNTSYFAIYGNTWEPNVILDLETVEPGYSRDGWTTMGIELLGDVIVDQIDGFIISANDYVNHYERYGIYVAVKASIQSMNSVTLDNLDYLIFMEYFAAIRNAYYFVSTYFGNAVNMREYSKARPNFFFKPGTKFNSNMDGTALKVRDYSDLACGFYDTGNITVEDSFTKKYDLQVFSYLESLDIPGIIAGTKDASCQFNLWDEESVMENTFGERRVRLDVNPGDDPQVALVKQKTAELIDLCETMKAEGKHAHCIEKAQDAFEDAATWAVRAIRAPASAT